jgi:Flp pilus assembly protein CpaB
MTPTSTTAVISAAIPSTAGLALPTTGARDTAPRLLCARMSLSARRISDSHQRRKAASSLRAGDRTAGPFVSAVGSVQSSVIVELAT